MTRRLPITTCPDSRRKRTDQLEPGDVLLIDGRLRRTVESVEPAGHVGMRGDDVFVVRYAEGAVAGEWSGANTGTAKTMWAMWAQAEDWLSRDCTCREQVPR